MGKQLSSGILLYRCRNGKLEFFLVHPGGPYWKNNDQISFNPSKLNAQISFLLRFAKAFKTKLSLNLTTSYDFGTIVILLNNTCITKSPIDLYSSNVYFKKLEFDNVSFEKGNNILSIQIVGKNASSTAMKIGIDTITITPN